MNKKSFLVISLLASFMLLILILKYYKTNLLKSKDTSNLVTAEDTIREHFKCQNEKNLTKLRKTITKNMWNISWNLENIKYIKLINIEEDLTNNIKDGYMKNGNGKYIKPREVQVFRVQYELKLKDDTESPITSGKHSDCYIVIKQNSNSSWQIDEIGE